MKKNIIFLIVIMNYLILSCSPPPNSSIDNTQSESTEQVIALNKPDSSQSENIQQTPPTFIAHLPIIKPNIIKPDSSLMLEQSQKTSLAFTQKYLNNVQFFCDTLCGNITNEVMYFVNQQKGKTQDEFTEKVDFRAIGILSQTPHYVSVLYYINHKGAEMCGAYNLASYFLVNYTIDGKIIEGIILAEQSSGADAPYYSSSDKTSKISSNTIEMKIENIVGDGDVGKEDVTLVDLSVKINDNGTFSKITENRKMENRKIPSM